MFDIHFAYVANEGGETICGAHLRLRGNTRHTRTR